jgi:hypothetical protein
MKSLKLVVHYVFFLFVLLLYLSRSFRWGFGHDENQFIAAGQLLADHSLLPYLNYPYTHMPYGVFFYALTAKLSIYDYLAGRILNAMAWLICSLLIIYISKLFWGTKRSLTLLIWEFVIVFLFLNHPSMVLISGIALNHSLASISSLLALIFFIRFTQQKELPHRAVFWSGIWISTAAWIRFNYVSLIVILFFLLLVYKVGSNPPLISRSFISFTAGLVIAALPMLVLVLLAPNGFLYGNIVYTRLNTIYYQELHFKTGMDLGSKISGFLSNTLSSPLDFILYVLLLFVGITSFVNYLRKKSLIDLNKLAVATFAFTLFLTAFAPTPLQQQYYFAPLPFLVIILTLIGFAIYQKHKLFFYLAILGLLFSLNPGLKTYNPLNDLEYLSKTSQWTPIQVHDFGDEIKQFVPKGRILTLSPMIPLEAGYDIYPFTITGPFSWRTSLLLTPQRRMLYGVISPEELSGLLKQDPPDGILTGFETPNAGFIRNDPGTLETPFINYAIDNKYKPISLYAAFIQRPIILWVRPN